MQTLLNDLTQDFLKGIAKPNTATSYRRDLVLFRQFMQVRYGHALHPSEIDIGVVDGFREWLEQTSKPTTLARRIWCVNSFARYLSNRGYLTSKVKLGMGDPRRREPDADFFTQDDMVRMLEALDDATPERSRDRAIIELLYATGLRLSQVPVLDLGDYDQRLHVLHTEERYLPVMGPAAEAMDEWLRVRIELVFRECDALFLDDNGDRMEDVKRVVEKYSTRAGINKNVTHETFCNTFAIHALAMGMDSRTVGQYLGTKLSQRDVWELIRWGKEGK